MGETESTTEGDCGGAVTDEVARLAANVAELEAQARFAQSIINQLVETRDLQMRRIAELTVARG